mgnify:CR=1 FL=1
MVTGSLALAAYATPRMTRDIDLVVELGTQDAERIVSLFEGDCYVAPDAVREAVAHRPDLHVNHMEWVAKADLVVRGGSAFRRKEFERRRQLRIEGQPVWFVAPEDLILSKLRWNAISPSEQQRQDVRDLLSAGIDLDFAYLERWADDLEVSATLDELRS